MKQKLIQLILFFIMLFISNIIFSGFVMLLWNWLIPSIFSGPTITFLQAFGLMWLVSLIRPQLNINNKKS